MRNNRSLLDLIHSLPVSQKLAMGDNRVSTACYISSILGNCSAVGSKRPTSSDPSEYPWEVNWASDESQIGCHLSRHGVYVSDDLDTAKMYQIIGYCAYQHIPFFTDSLILQMLNAEDETKQ